MKYSDLYGIMYLVRYTDGNAALAQLVERRLGKAEVGGSNPLGSLIERQRPFCFMSRKSDAKQSGLF